MRFLEAAMPFIATLIVANINCNYFAIMTIENDHSSYCTTRENVSLADTQRLSGEQDIVACNIPVEISSPAVTNLEANSTFDQAWNTGMIPKQNWGGDARTVVIRIVPKV